MRVDVEAGRMVDVEGGGFAGSLVRVERVFDKAGERGDVKKTMIGLGRRDSTTVGSDVRVVDVGVVGVVDAVAVAVVMVMVEV